MSNNLHVVVGLGSTGVSSVRFCMRENIPVAVTDTRSNPPNLAELVQNFPNVQFSLGGLDEDLLNQASTLVVSPGIALTTPQIAQQKEKGKRILGDIELFAKTVTAPVIGITGTNAKSTVTTLVGLMAKEAGLHVGVGGNLGTPALDSLSIKNPDLFVLELSSFQLETTYSLKLAVASILNITPDHMDRYVTLQDYSNAKHRIYSDCDIAVANRDDKLTECKNPHCQHVYFTLNEPGINEFGLIKQNGEKYLAYESTKLISVNELPILGRHYQANALAALAIGHAFGFPMNAMIGTLKKFKGLPHRCQLVREKNHIRWYNDSKGTNVGATLAAIEGLGPEIQGSLILIAGGVGKNADFTPLVPAIHKYVKTVILIGEAAPILAEVIGDRVEIRMAKSMEDAVSIAETIAHPNDSVLHGGN